MTVAAGSRLGPYEIVAPLGAGGMGEVWKARDTRLGRMVAIKVVPQRLSASPEARQRFEREAKTISRLSHPHICTLYDVGREGETEFLVMELIEGETLSERLARGPLPLDQTLRCGIEIADALDKAHRQGIVHRDLKPGNVMLTVSGVKLLDFGLARALESEESAADATSIPTAAGNVTREGAIVGTLAYMAPEQLEAKKADTRTDIFALGAVLYEMATGRRAFEGGSQASLIASILTSDPPPVSSIQRMNPQTLDRLVKRCLAKDPEQRWQSARDIALELESIREAADRDATAPPARRRLGWAAAGWALAAALAVAGLTLRPWAARPAPASPVRFLVAPPRGATLAGMLALAPDGKTLAFVATGSDGRDLLYLRPLDSLEPISMAGTDGAAYPFWSPDGRSIAFFAQGKLKRIEASGSSLRTICDAPAPRGGSWSTRGTIVFAANAGGLMSVVSQEGGEPRAIAALSSRAGETLRWPSFLPDGLHFLFFQFGGSQRGAGIYAASLDGKETVRIATGDSGAAYAAPGYLLYRAEDRLVTQPFDASRLKATGDPVPVVEDVWWDGISTLATGFSVSSGGVLAYQTGGLQKTRLLVYDRDGREMGDIGPGGAYFEPALSPDGRRVAVARAEKHGSAIWLMDIERGSSARFSFDSAASDASPLWTADGRRILYGVFPSGEVYARDSAGSEREKLLFKLPAFWPLDDVSRDGRYLFLESVDWPKFHFDVTLRDLQSGSERALLKEPFNELGARLSPDGRWLAYESEESGGREVFVRSFPDLKDRRQISVNGGGQPRWRGDGRELYFVSPDRKLMAVAIRTEPALEADPPRVLFQTRILPAIEARNHYDAALDGRRFVINSSRPEDASLPITVVVNWEAGFPRPPR